MKKKLKKKNNKKKKIMQAKKRKTFDQEVTEIWLTILAMASGLADTYCISVGLQC